ncbi:peptidylprolyl isomerase [Hydrogenovibrio sp. SC-1]|uniref:SurA N-terminal domain-containing protein n=1 Tax=Hydrogenovibrio sp. SC-1 TaxID=2065820 RepID=UPI000C7A0E1A|nr:SurA N-terminal domain-containing protein [Hydrogenovibrio sp. SC-1]PLA74913.1 peptidylprolyl isomerase [Hydrogenovibrio sp. SC-1]
MLQSIRDHAQGWIAWVIVSLIILTFALFGIDQYAQGDKIVVVAEVNGEEVTANEFLSLYDRQKNRLKNQFGDMYDQVVDDAELRDQVMDALVESEVIQQWASDHNMRVSDAQVFAMIESAPVFQKDGQFDKQLYQDILMRNGLNIARFEYEQRRFMVETQNRQLTMASAIATDQQVKNLAALQFQQRQVNTLRIDQRPFMEQAVPTAAEIENYYQANQDQYRVPEKVSIQYVLLSQADLAEKVEVNDQQRKAFYDNNKDQFVQPKQRQASHILIQINETTSEAEAKKQITDIASKIEAGEDFEALAKAHSQDPGSANIGGDLGMFQQGMMVPEFDKTVFSMQPGEVSEPIKTDFGYHLIKLTQIQPKQTPEYDAVKADVEAQLRRQLAEKTYFEKLEQLSTVAYEQADAIEPAADVTGLKVKTSELFSQQGGTDEVTSNPKVITAAFSEEVKQSKLNSATIELSPTESVVIRVKEVVPAQQQSLDDVSASIESDLKRQAGIQASAQKAAELQAQLQLGKVKMAELEEEGVEFAQLGWLSRENQSVLPQVTAAIFKAPKPQGQPIYTTFAMPTGDSMVLEVMDVKEGELPKQAASLSQLKSALVEVSSVAEADARVKAMVASAEVVIRDNYKTINLR